MADNQRGNIVTKKHRDLIRHNKRIWQKARMEWKKEHLAEAVEKAIADRMDSARRAVARGDRELARALKAEIKHEAYLTRRAEREEARNLKGALKPKQVSKTNWFGQISAALTRLTHRPSGGARIAGAK